MNANVETAMKTGAELDFTVLESKLMLVTPEMATAWLRRNVGNRDPRRIYAKSLGNQMKRGEWLVTHQGVAFTRSGVMIDGQHRLIGIAESGVAVVMFVTTGLDDEVFKAIDGHIRRSMADRTRLPKNAANACNFAAKLLYTARDISPETVIAIANAGVLDAYDVVVHACATTTARYYTSAPFRLAAYIRLMDGVEADYVTGLYGALVSHDYDRFPDFAKSLDRQERNGEINCRDEFGTLARGLKVFDPGSKGLTMIRITENNQATLLDYARKVLRRGLGETQP